MSSIYTVQPGNTIRDVCLNATGSMVNWNAICKANGFTTWTPNLLVGQEVIIPDGVQLDVNPFAAFQSYPTSNTNRSNALEVLTQIWNIITDRWILRTGFWDDTGIWEDKAFWKDNP